MEEIPEEPAEGYRPEFMRPRALPKPGGLKTETWLDVQTFAAIALWDVLASWEVVTFKASAHVVVTDLLNLPAGWIATRLLREIHELATFAVVSVACGAPTPPTPGVGFPVALDAISAVTGTDALAMFRERAAALHQGMSSGPLIELSRVQVAAAELAWLIREFARCARCRIGYTRDLMPGVGGAPVYAEVLGHVIRAASVGMNLGDAAAARLFDVATAALADLSAGLPPLHKVALPSSTYTGKGSNGRRIQDLTDQVVRDVLPAIASQMHYQGPAGGALLRVALVMGHGPGGGADTGDEGSVPTYEALRACWAQAENDPRVWEAEDPPAFARQLVLRALDALGHDTKAMLEYEAQDAKRGRRAAEFRALDDAGRARQVRTLLRSHKGGARAVAGYLGVPVAEVRAVMAANDSTMPRAKTTAKPLPKRG